MTTLNTAICTRLKRRLKQAGLAYRDVAEQLGISEVSVKRLLNQQQPLSMDRVIEMMELLQESLSDLISEAEKLVAVTPTFTMEQDQAFCAQPELYTLFMEIVCANVTAQELMTKFELNQASVYLYLRQLENIGLITITSALHFRLLVPRDTVFADHGQFPMFFKNQIIDGLKNRIQQINSKHQEAYFLTAKLRLTAEEFADYRRQLEEQMQMALRLSQYRKGAAENVHEYTIVDMGAAGRFHPELKKPVNLVNTDEA